MNDLLNKRILVVEDEVVIAFMLEDMLAEMGAVVVGPAYSLKAGLELAQTAEIDGAVLDVNLGDGDSSGIADMLAARTIPFMFATGYGLATENKHGAVILQKPCLSADLERELLRMFRH